MGGGGGGVVAGGGGVEGAGGQRIVKTGFPKNHAIQLAANPLCWTFYL